MEKNAKIFIAWHNWLVWSAIKRKLEDFGYTNLICKTRKELDLLDQIILILPISYIKIFKFKII